jgi:pimeloyl-ACP methyl ester carboxylesterase
MTLWTPAPAAETGDRSAASPLDALRPADRDGGPAPLILLHGFPMDRGLWEDVGAAWGEDRPVLAVDLPGFGDSGWDGDTFEMAETADWLVATLEALQIRRPIVLMGLSMGGYIALEFAARHPARLAHLVLCNSRAEADSEAARAGRLQVAETVAERGVEALVESMLPKLLAPSTWQQRPAVVKRLREMMRRSSAASIAAAQRGMAARRGLLEAIASWPVPITCISGEEDGLTGPSVMQPIVDRGRQATLHVVPHAGHVTPLENPAGLVSAVRTSLCPDPL